MVFYRNCRKYIFYNTICNNTIPGNPINGRGGDTDVVDMTCELAHSVYSNNWNNTSQGKKHKSC